MKPLIKVEGIDKSISFVDLISTRIGQRLENETATGAKEIQRREKMLAPVKSGYLRKSIVNRKGKYGTSRMVRAKAPHAPLQEYGTKRGVKAKHFAERTRKELLPRIQEKIRAAVSEEVKR